MCVEKGYVERRKVVVVLVVVVVARRVKRYNVASRYPARRNSADSARGTETLTISECTGLGHDSVGNMALNRLLVEPNFDHAPEMTTGSYQLGPRFSSVRERGEDVGDALATLPVSGDWVSRGEVSNTPVNLHPKCPSLLDHAW